MKPITELGKPSILTVSSVFSTISIAIVDTDHKLALLIKKLLYGLGCQHIFVVHDGLDCLQLMKEEQIDIIITEWQTKSMGGLDLTTYLRQSLDSPNRMIPIVMLTARCDHQDIQQARDAGITEYLVKPFSAKSLLERIHTIVEDPRSFIICKSYTGPDRRRISSLTLPPDPDTNRQYFERKPPVVVPKDQLKQIILDDTPRMIMPDYTLKKKIGFDVPAELITNPLTVAQTEEEIQKVQDEFLQSMMKDVETLNKSYQTLIAHPDSLKKMIPAISDAAYSIKSRAGIFGYQRASEVATQLYNFSRRYYDKNNKYHLIILEKHIQTIGVIFTQKIRDDGGEIGKELLKDLARLINKYINHKD